MKLQFRKNRKQFFRGALIGYYRLKPWRFIRRLGGPVISLLGMIIRQGEFKVFKGFGAFCIGYGIYYALKPWLSMAYALRKFEEQTVSLDYSREEGICCYTLGENRVEYKVLNPFAERIGKWGILWGDLDNPQFRMAIPHNSMIQGDLALFMKEVSEKTDGI